MSGEQEVPQDLARGEITKYLLAWSAGDGRAASPAFTALYATLRRLARRALSAERTDHTLGTAGLIGEAFLRLREQQRVEWRSREHFIAIAAQMMRRVLIDHARGRATAKRRRGGEDASPVVDAAWLGDDALDGVIAVHDAIEVLAVLDPMQSQIIELRFFGGMSHDEIASYFGISLTTVERRWRLARAWLYRRLKESAV